MPRSLQLITGNMWQAEFHHYDNPYFMWFDEVNNYCRISVYPWQSRGSCRCILSCYGASEIVDAIITTIMTHSTKQIKVNMVNG